MVHEKMMVKCEKEKMYDEWYARHGNRTKDERTKRDIRAFPVYTIDGREKKNVDLFFPLFGFWTFRTFAHRPNRNWFSKESEYAVSNSDSTVPFHFASSLLPLPSLALKTWCVVSYHPLQQSMKHDNLRENCCLQCCWVVGLLAIHMHTNNIWKDIHRLYWTVGLLD